MTAMTSPGMDDVLGCCLNRASVWDRGLRTKIADLDRDTIELEYSRVLDDLSEASVVVGRSGACCDALDRVRGGRHMLVIERCSGVAWAGPIMRTTYGTTETIIEATDPLVWLDRRLVRRDRQISGSLAGIAMELVREALVHPDGAVDETGIQWDVRACPDLGEREYEACRSSVAAELRTLARGPFNFTAVGTRVVMWCGGELGRTNVMQDKDFMGELRVVEDVYSLATAICVQGKGVTGYAGGTDDYYGLWEQAVKDDTITTAAEANALAAREVAARNRPPLVLSVPDGVRLDPRAPVSFHKLVPGVTMPVWSTSTCRTVSQDMAITRVRVRQGGGSSGGDEEEVMVTVAPVASIGGGGDDF